MPRDFLFVIGRKWHILFMSLLLLFFFYMSLPNGRRVGELRVDPADLLQYRWTGSAWEVNGAGTPSSSAFPDGRYAGEIREHKASGRSYRWSGSAWVLLPGAISDTDADGYADLAADSVGKTELNYTVETVTVTASTTGTATVTSGAQILGYHVTAITGAEHVKTIDIASTTLTVTLTGSDTATIQVIVLEP